jgi:uncharacterized protein YcfJ
MKTSISIGAAAALASLAAGAVQAQEFSGRVISSTPVVQQVQVPRQVCNNQPVAVQQPRSGAGAVIGAIAGGVLGNTIGHGSGRALATGIGLMGGAVVGNQIEGGGTSLQGATTCSTQTFHENRTVGYNVTYEYGGREYTVQMPNDPGPSVRLQVSPLGASAPSASMPSESYPVAGGGMSAPAGTVSVPAVVASSTAVYPVAYPAYQAYPAYPAYPGYYPSYYPPIGISLGFGFGGGHHHGGHWRR